MLKVLIGSLLLLVAAQDGRSPASLVDELLATDGLHGVKGRRLTAADALTEMFADDVVMMKGAPSPGFARGKAQAADALAANPDNQTGRLTWAPVRGGVSADGRHGFTFGYMTLTRADGSTAPLKYVAYWRKTTEGWRVAVYKRAFADKPPASAERMPPSLPAQLVPPSSDTTALAAHTASLEAAERAFSDEAQKIGLGAAFAKHGHPDAVNVGPRSSPEFVVGAAAIGQSVGAGTPTTSSPLRWAPDEGSLVASSGDLGVTFGFIRSNDPAAAGGAAQPIPFVTIWRRASPQDVWKYIAE